MPAAKLILMNAYVAVALGSAAGGVLRFALAGWLMRAAGGTFPWGTLAVNVVGCALIGAFAVCVPPNERGFPWRLFLLPGLCGGFTTFSAFSLESLTLWRGEEVERALVYVAASVILCLAAVWGGVQVGARFTGNSLN